MRFTTAQRADILEYARQHGLSPAAHHYSVSVNTIKSWQRRHGQQRANADTHAENKTGAVDDVSPAQLRSIAARLSQTLDRYLTSGQTVRIGPLSRAVGDLVRAAEKLGTLPPAGELERVYGQQMAQIIDWTFTELGYDAKDPAVGPILRHNLLKVSGTASETELRRAEEESRAARGARYDRQQEQLRRVLAEYDEKDKQRAASKCPACGRGPLRDEPAPTGAIEPPSDAKSQVSTDLVPVGAHRVTPPSTHIDDDEVVEGEILEDEAELERQRIEAMDPHERFGVQLDEALRRAHIEGTDAPHWFRPGRLPYRGG